MPTWTAPTVERSDPPRVADERTAVETALDYQRQTLLLRCAGLTADQLTQRAVPPSSLSLLGLVRHMALVQRWWFQINAAGRDLELPFTHADNPDWEFDALDVAAAEADLATYRAEVDTARAAVADLPLEHTFTSRRRAQMDLRWVYLHMLEEYARHNGHADLLRECIDGTTGD